MIFWIALYIAFPVWVLFFGGAERLENTFLGYFTHGVAGEKVVFIKICAWIGLAWGAYATFRWAAS